MIEIGKVNFQFVESRKSEFIENGRKEIYKRTYKD